jgi:TM2 domain-containing membrane protein YozV
VPPPPPVPEPFAPPAEVLNVEVPPATPPPPQNLPPAPGGEHDDTEVTLVQEPPGQALAPPAVAAPPPEVAYEPPAVEAPPAQPVAAPAPVIPTMTDPGWYLTSNGQVYGPYQADDIRGWLRSGQTAWDTQASRGGDDPWRALHTIAEFNPSPAYGVPLGAAPAAGNKDRTVAGILGILLGVVGAHHWYLGNYLLAVLYLLFGWTGIPSLLGIVEGIIYLTAPEDRFQRNYNRWFLSGA